MSTPILGSCRSGYPPVCGLQSSGTWAPGCGALAVSAYTQAASLGLRLPGGCHLHEKPLGSHQVLPWRDVLHQWEAGRDKVPAASVLWGGRGQVSWRCLPPRECSWCPVLLLACKVSHVQRALSRQDACRPPVGGPGPLGASGSAVLKGETGGVLRMRSDVLACLFFKKALLL